MPLEEGCCATGGWPNAGWDLGPLLGNFRGGVCTFEATEPVCGVGRITREEEVDHFVQCLAVRGCWRRPLSEFVDAERQSQVTGLVAKRGAVAGEFAAGVLDRLQ